MQIKEKVEIAFEQSFTLSVCLKVLRVPSGKTLSKLTGHTRTVHHCQFTDDGETLLTSSEDTTVRVIHF